MRSLWIFALVAALSQSGCGPIYRHLGGDYGPPQPISVLSPEARALVDAAAADIDPDRYLDAHVHMIGPTVDPRAASPWHPLHYGRTRVLLAAAGIGPDDDWEAAYMERLLGLIDTQPVRGRHLLYALDSAHDADGRPVTEDTPLYVANITVMAWAGRHPDTLVPVISIHPRREDALQRLDHWAEAGACFVKWLPNSMGMDPADPRLDPFYARMREYGMTLLSHTGTERALPASDQDLGNPLRLRRPLEHGVRVVALHAAGDGTHRDLDHPDQPDTSGWRLLLRLFDDPAYDDLLFADTSALTFRTHTPEPLLTLLARPDLQERFVHGSDYPLPGVPVATSLRGLARAGLIPHETVTPLAEIRDWNPLAFDFVLKRTLRHPESGARLDPELFMADAESAEGCQSLRSGFTRGESRRVRIKRNVGVGPG